MIKVTYILLLFLFSFELLGQVDSLQNTYIILEQKIYLNSDWKVCDSTQASFFRIMSKNKENIYTVKDFYKNGTLQMEAQVSAIEPLNYHGFCTYYYPSGKIQSRGSYLENKKVGTWKYYNKKGRFPEIIDYTALEAPIYDSGSWKPQNQSSLLIGNISYRCKLNRSYLNSGHGLSFEGGFNAGYFISQHLLLAPFVGMGMRDIFWNTRFTKQFQNDFDANFIGTSLTGNDSIVLNKYKMLMKEGHIFHDALQYYGILIRLPYKYAPIIKVYRGVLSHNLKLGSNYRPGLKPYMPGDKLYDHDYYSQSMNLTIGVEVFLYNGYTTVKDYDPVTHPRRYKKNKRWCTNLFALSIYAEQLDVKHTKFSYSDGYHNVDKNFSDFMNPTFTNKYSKAYNIGLRLSFGVF